MYKQLGGLWLKKHPEYKLLPLQTKDFFDTVREWLQQERDETKKELDNCSMEKSFAKIGIACQVRKLNELLEKLE